MYWCKNVLLLFLLFTLIGQGVSADQNGTAGPAVVKIGAIYNLNGSQATLDLPSSRGVLTAERTINTHGGTGGVLVEVLLRDGNSDPALIGKIAEDLIVNESVPVIIGLSDTDMVLPAANVAARYHVPFITSGASSPELPVEVPGYLYLACFSDNAQAALAAEYAYRNLSCRSAAVLYDADMQYTTLLSEYFSERFRELGGTVSAKFPVNQGSDLTALLANRTPAEDPDLYYVAVGPEAAPGAVRAVHNGTGTAPVFGGDSYDTKDLLDAVNRTAGPVYYTTHAWFGGNSLSPATREFVQEYREMYGTDPTPFAGLGYDTVMLVAKAAGNGISGEEIRKGIDRIRDYQGVTGVISYGNGSVIPEKSVFLMAADRGNLTLAADRVPEKVPAA
jgi:branched-chain amino acid transport system substrate-binding protein